MKLSQHSLTDFVECPRRYYLRYVAHQPAAALETSDAEALRYRSYLRQGVHLHTLIERYWLDIECNPRLDAERDDEVATWWSRFIGTDFGELPPQRTPELALSASIGEHQLYARFDLLCTGDQHAVIIDWKTLRGKRAPSLATFAQRIQTRVYLYVLASAGAPFNGGAALAPEQCEMHYWFANFPQQSWLRVRYSRDEFESDAARFTRLISDIEARTAQGEDAFAKTDDERQCTYCPFRAVCQRRVVPDVEMPDETEAVADFRNAPELEY